MLEKIGNYTQEESNELWDAWANQFAQDHPEEAAEFVEKMTEGEADGTE